MNAWRIEDEEDERKRDLKEERGREETDWRLAPNKNTIKMKFNSDLEIQQLLDRNNTLLSNWYL